MEGNHVSFLHSARMARDPLAVHACSCSVEWSISGHIATWQRTISDLMMYKVAMNLKEIAPELEEEDISVPEMLGKIQWSGSKIGGKGS